MNTVKPCPKAKFPAWHKEIGPGMYFVCHLYGMFVYGYTLDRDLTPEEKELDSEGFFPTRCFSTELPSGSETLTYPGSVIKLLSKEQFEAAARHRWPNYRAGVQSILDIPSN